MRYQTAHDTASMDRVILSSCHGEKGHDTSPRCPPAAAGAGLPSGAGNGGSLVENKMTGVGMFTLASLIWGTAPVAQSAGMDHVGPFTFNAVRFLIGAAVLPPFMRLPARRMREKRAAALRASGLVGPVGQAGLCSGSLFRGPALRSGPVRHRLPATDRHHDHVRGKSRLHHRALYRHHAGAGALPRQARPASALGPHRPGHGRSFAGRRREWCVF